MLITLNIEPDTFRDLVISTKKGGREVLALGFTEYVKGETNLGSCLTSSQVKKLTKALGKDESQKLFDHNIPAFSQNRWFLEVIKLEKEHVA